MMAETRKILGAAEEELGISATCVRVPVFVGHSRVGQRADARAAVARGVPRAARRRAPGVIVVDAPGEGVYPLATDVAGRDEVLVGRIRRDPSHERCLNLWVVGDNLRKGAATNAVQVAEVLARARPRPRPGRRLQRSPPSHACSRAIASAALIVGGSLAVGQAVARALRAPRRGRWLAGPVGLARAARRRGHRRRAGRARRPRSRSCSGVALAAVAALASGGCADGAGRRSGAAWPRAGAVVLALLAASIPFIAAGRRRHPRRRPGQRRHGLAPAARRLDRRALPARAGADRPGLSARPARAGRRPGDGAATRARSTSSPASRWRSRRSPRWSRSRRSTGCGRGCACSPPALVALPYLAAAYLAQEAFKEPIMALFVLAFALLLGAGARLARRGAARRARRRRRLRLLVPGLAWLGGVAIVWGARRARRAPRRRGAARHGPGRSVASPPAVAVGVGVAVARSCCPSLGAGRLRTSPTSARCIPTGPTRAGSATCPASSRRWRRSGSGRRASSGSRPRRAEPARRSSSTPAALFALVCLALALPRWIRAHGPAIPAALLAAAVLYLLARALGTVYTSAKALAIAAPLIALVILGGLLGAATARRAARSLGVASRLAAAFSQLPDPAPGAGRPRGPRRRARARSGRSSRARSCSSSAATTSSSTSCAARSRSPTCATSTTPTSSSPTSSSPTSARSSTSTRSPPRRSPGSRTCSPPAPATPAARRPATGWSSAPTPTSSGRSGRSPLGRCPAEIDAAPGPRRRLSRGPAAPGRRRSPRRRSSPRRPSWSQDDDRERRVGDASTLDLPAGSWELSLQYDATRPLTPHRRRRDRPRRHPARQPRLPRHGAVLARRDGSRSPAATPVRITADGRATAARRPAARRPLGRPPGRARGDQRRARRDGGCRGYVDWYMR